MPTLPRAHTNGKTRPPVQAPRAVPALDAPCLPSIYDTDLHTLELSYMLVERLATLHKVHDLLLKLMRSKHPLPTKQRDADRLRGMLADLEGLGQIEWPALLNEFAVLVTWLREEEEARADDATPPA